jgi:hypothetical protein
MDFFDPEKQKRHTLRLAVWYGVIGVLVVIATTLMLYQVRGYWFDKDGNLIQNGLVFASSHPTGAEVYISDKKYKNTTNTRMNLPAGQYTIELRRTGYNSWRRMVSVRGGKVERLYYPLLFPTKLTTTPVTQYTAPPGVSAQSPDRRWLLIGTPTPNSFDLYDLNQKQISATTLSVSPDILSAGSTTTSWQLVEWSKDNRHVLLRRFYDKPGAPGSEYILFDREAPEQSQNLSVVLGFTPTIIELRNQAYDQYYLFDQNNSQVFTASLKQPTPQVYISGVLAFTSEGDVIVYATTENAEAGKSLIRIKQKDGQPMTVRQVQVGSSYLLDMAVYEGDLYLVAGAASENQVFVYRDPIGQLKNKSLVFLVPVRTLKVEAPSHVSFSANKRMVMAENADHFAVYDAETKRGYTYQTGLALDAPQLNAVWMDGFRLTYISGGNQVAFDFDGTNVHSLVAAAPAQTAFFDHNYRFMYTIAGNNLTSTALLVKEDL